MDLLNKLLKKGTANNKYFPQIVYGGCLLAIYTSILLPLSNLWGIDLPRVLLADNEIFWYSWSIIVTGGSIQRSIIKIDKNYILQKLKN